MVWSTTYRSFPPADFNFLIPKYGVTLTWHCVVWWLLISVVGDPVSSKHTISCPLTSATTLVDWLGLMLAQFKNCSSSSLLVEFDEVEVLDGRKLRLSYLVKFLYPQSHRFLRTLQLF